MKFSKKGLVVILLVVALLFSIFSLVEFFASSTNSTADYGGGGGNLNLRVLPPETSVGETIVSDNDSSVGVGQ